MDPVRRTSDGELCGFVERRSDRWHALTVFGAVLDDHPGREEAVAHVLADGLASLADRWILRDGAGGEEEIVCIQEANAHAVTLALGYYALPGVPTLTITVEQLAAGEWTLSR